MKKTAAALLALAVAAQLAAAPLTAADQGDYVLLDQNENPPPCRCSLPCKDRNGS